MNLLCISILFFFLLKRKQPHHHHLLLLRFPIRNHYKQRSILKGVEIGARIIQIQERTHYTLHVDTDFLHYLNFKK